MLKRTLAALVLALIGLPAVYLGGIYLFLLIAVFLGLAAWEYGRMFQKTGNHASLPTLVGGVLVILTTRIYFPDFVFLALTISVLTAMAWHLVDYERGCDTAGVDFAITTAGFLYLGWIGAFLVELRGLDDGLWWFFLVLVSVWLADSFAYFIGVRFGKHKLSPRLSPKKTWEGYWGGVVFGTLGSVGLAMLFVAIGGPEVLWWKAAILGLALSTLTTLGDLGESLLKRYVGVKDSSNLIPGHGGFFDRIDSWLWGAAIGFYLVTWLIM